MFTRTKIGTSVLTAAIAFGSLGALAGTATGAEGQDRTTARQDTRQNRDFNPTLEKINFKKILAEADDVNRSNTIKLMVDRQGSWRTIQVWNPSNARDANFAEIVSVRRVGDIDRYILRVVDRDINNRVIQVQDSDSRNSGGNPGGGNPGGGNPGGGNPGGGNPGGGDDGGLGGILG